MNGNCSQVVSKLPGVDNIDAGPCRGHFYSQNPKLKAAWYDDIFAIVCTVLYLADIITDLLVSVKYFRSGDYIWFSLTLACVLGASTVMMVFSLKWFYDDTAEEVSKRRIVVFHLLQLGPLQRYWQAYWNGKRSRKVDANPSCYRIYVEQWRDIAMLRLFEAFIESAPQLVLQLYILAYNRHFDKDKDWLTAFSACISLLSLSTSIVSYSKALREALEMKGKMSWWAFACQIVWRLSMVGSRIVTLVLFASVYKSWILLVIGLHWLFMTLWLLYQKTSFCSSKTLERLFSVVIGFIYIFCFFNPKDGFTRKRLILFYSVLFIEDCVLMGMWLPHRNEYGVVFVAAVAMVFGGFFLGIFAMFLYYQYYHPSLEVQGVCVRTRHEVPPAEATVRRLFCCNGCDDEPLEAPTGSHLEIDIEVSRGSVGRSVRNNRETSPSFEKELFVHEPSELQKQYSLERHKIKKEKAERARRLHEQENGVQNALYLEQSQAMEDPQGELLGNGTAVNHERPPENGAIAIDIGGNESFAQVNEEQTGTRVPLTKKTCDDGLHCGTDDEEGTGTNAPISKRTCDDGLHCGTDDEKKTGASVLSNERTCDDGWHCGTDEEDDSKKGELKLILRHKYYSNLNFRHRYSIVSDCISLSSSSSDTIEDEPLKQDVKTGSVPCTVELENDPGVEQVRHDGNGEIADEAPQHNAQGSCTMHISQSHRTTHSLSKNVISGENVKRRKVRKRKPLNRVSFPNFVATNLKHGKFSSLRTSREDFAGESYLKNKRHTVDFSELTSDRPHRKNKYTRLVKRLKPGKFGSVREELEELSLNFDQESCTAIKTPGTERNFTKKFERPYMRKLKDRTCDVESQRKTGNMQCTSDSELLKRSEITPSQRPENQVRKLGDTKLDDFDDLSRDHCPKKSLTLCDDNGSLLSLKKSEDNSCRNGNKPDPFLSTTRYHSEKRDISCTESSSTPNKRHTINFPCFLEENYKDCEANYLSPVTKETPVTADMQVPRDQKRPIWVRREGNLKRRDRLRPLSSSFAELGIREKFLLLKETPILI